MADVEILTKKELLKLNGKYIFHGSHALFDVCKPHKASCGSHKKENEQNAIYGSDNLTFAALFAFEKQPREHYSWRVDFCDGKWLGILSDNSFIKDNDFGYLYLFNKSLFVPTEVGGSQFVCKKEALPQRIIKIFYSDFKDQFKTETEIKKGT